MIAKQRLFKLISEFKLVFKKNTTTTNEKVVSSLAPKILSKEEDLAKIQPYLDKLKDTIDTKGVNNIALTGGYGSGKSTIINTFKSLNSQYKYLNISLASFNKKKEDKNDKLTPKQRKLQREELERLLEVSILQQIFYHVKPTEIPESRFKRIINIPNWKLWGISIGFILWVSSSVLLLKYDYLDKIDPTHWNTKDNFDWFAFLIFIIAFTGLGVFSKLVVKLFSNSQINKVSIKGELELGNNVNKSVFNEHLEEILYFFERTDFNVVIIEDLDRFDSTDIFTKLREINILLNNSQLINQEINFVYAVGDALFNDKKERVKFFEYIIPVIPFINSSNAEEQLMTLIKESDLEDYVFSKEFLSDITTFIDDIDMRLLINIFHEFSVYRNVLKPDLIRGSEAELFSMITYKNLDPKDYDALNSKKGKLYKLLNDKKRYTEELIEKINKDVDLKESELKKINNENITKIKELRKIYLYQILTKLPNTAIYVSQLKIAKLIEDDEFEKLIEEESKSYYWQNQGYGSGFERTFSFNFSEIENEVNPDITYEERVELIESKHNNKIELLQKEIEKLKIKKSEIENWDLKQIFKEVGVNQYLNDFTNSGLLRNLVLEGYINENYNDYISLFHEVSLTKEDKKFERSVKGAFNEKFDYGLTHIEKLINNHLDIKYFDREAILNFDLLDFLGKNFINYSKKYEAIIVQLSNEKERSIEFIEKYIEDESRPLKIFIEKLVQRWKGFWEYIYNQNSYTNDKKNRYLRIIIHFVNNDSIITNQNTSLLAEAIEKNPDFFLLVKDIEKEKVTDLFNKLKVKFESLTAPNKETKPLFDYVYQNHHYKINADNISFLLKIFKADIIDKNINECNYTTILESDCEALIEYVNSNINIYIKNVFLKLSDNKLEAESNLISLLNNKGLKTGLKTQIIQKTETLIINLEEIEDVEIKKQLLTYNKVVPTWGNVTNYYSSVESNIDETLVEFLNTESVYPKLGEERMPKSSEGFDYPNFREAIILCNELSCESYTTILRGSNYQRKFISNGELNVNEDKAKFLAENIFATTKQNYDLLRDNHEDYHIILIENDFETFINQNDDFEIDRGDVLSILKSEKIDDADKLRYIPLIGEQIIAENEEIYKLINKLIINNDTKVELSSNTLKTIIDNYSSIEDNIKLINIYYNDLEDDDIVHLVSKLGVSYSEMFRKRYKPTFNDTIYHRQLFDKLEGSGLIIKYRTDKKNSDLLRVSANY